MTTTSPEPVKRYHAEELYSLEGNPTHPERERVKAVLAHDFDRLEFEHAAVLLANKMLIERDVAHDKLVGELMRYVRHTNGCRNTPTRTPCTCGLDALRRSLAPKDPTP